MISLSNISYTYKDTAKHVMGLRNTSVNFTEGSFTAIVGSSGCGKSTLLRAIAGLIKPDEGTINLEKSLSMVFQGSALMPWLTSIDNVKFSLIPKNMTAHEKQTTALHMLELLKMDQYKNSYPRELSGGQKQRIGIARALATNPSVLLLDEAFSALDAETTTELHAELLDIWQKKSITIIMVSHSIDEAVKLADRVVVMKKGTVVEEIIIPNPRSMTDIQTLEIESRIRKLI